MLPRAQFDVSALYYQKSLYTDPARAEAFKAKYGHALAVPETWDQFRDQAINRWFHELGVANGGRMFTPAFNSPAGKQALLWVVDLYAAGAVPPGTTNDLWDDPGNGFASGTVGINLDWPGWAGFFNDPAASRVAGNVGVAPAPKGSAGVRTGC